MRYSNKKGMSIIDVVLAMAIVGVLVVMYYGGLKMYAKYTTRVNDSIYTNTALIECAEVVHSIRYGELDKLGTAGWDSYIGKYPTGLYQLSYNDTTNVWDLNPIYKDATTEEPYLNFREMLDVTGYTDATKGELFTVGPKKIQIRRYLFLNNDIPDKSNVSCYVKYYNPFYKRQFNTDVQDLRNYESLNFIMTNYM